MQVFQLERVTPFQIQELVDIAQILLVQLAVVGERYLPLGPSYVVGKVSVHGVVGVLDLRFRGHGKRRKRLEEGVSELSKANLARKRLVDGEKLLLGFGHEPVVGQGQHLAEHEHAQVLEIVQFPVLEQRRDD